MLTQSEKLQQLSRILNDLDTGPESPISRGRLTELSNRLKILELRVYYGLSYVDAVDRFLVERSGTDLFRQKGRASKKTRTRIMDRDGNRCTKCKSTDNLQVHHIIPRRLGGKNTEDNLITLCRICHPKEEKISHSKPALKNIEDAVREYDG